MRGALVTDYGILVFAHVLNTSERVAVQVFQHWIIETSNKPRCTPYGRISFKWFFSNSEISKAYSMKP